MRSRLTAKALQWLDESVQFIAAGHTSCAAAGEVHEVFTLFTILYYTVCCAVQGVVCWARQLSRQGSKSSVFMYCGSPTPISLNSVVGGKFCVSGTKRDGL